MKKIFISLVLVAMLSISLVAAGTGWSIKDMFKNKDKVVQAPTDASCSTIAAQNRQLLLFIIDYLGISSTEVGSISGNAVANVMKTGVSTRTSVNVRNVAQPTMRFPANLINLNAAQQRDLTAILNRVKITDGLNVNEMQILSAQGFDSNQIQLIQSLIEQIKQGTTSPKPDAPGCSGVGPCGSKSCPGGPPQPCFCNSEVCMCPDCGSGISSGGAGVDLSAITQVITNQINLENRVVSNIGNWQQPNVPTQV